MTLKQPALSVLGISPATAQRLPVEAVQAMAEGIFRSLMNKYHPDKNEGRNPPASINLSDLAEAIAQVRNDVSKCVSEVSSKQRATKQEKNNAALLQTITEQEVDMGTLQETVQKLWHRSVLRGFKMKGSELVTKRDNRTFYNTENLSGLGIIISAEANSYREFLLDQDVWFTRTLTKNIISKKRPRPPGLPPELVKVTSNYYYDQSAPFEVLQNFQVIGSYTKKDLEKEQEKAGDKAGANQPKSKALPLGLTLSSKKPSDLDLLVSTVLQPEISTGSIALCAELDTGGVVRYKELGSVILVRVFDSRQRK